MRCKCHFGNRINCRVGGKKRVVKDEQLFLRPLADATPAELWSKSIGLVEDSSRPKFRLRDGLTSSRHLRPGNNLGGDAKATL